MSNDTVVDQGMQAADGFLTGVRVLEVANELGEYCGKLLAGLGADVVKVEPPGGEVTRTYGPFYHDKPHPDRSLHFWHYNLGKRSIILDLDAEDGQEAFQTLAAAADVIIDTRPIGWMEQRGVGADRLRTEHPNLIYVRISPFGDTGPWAGFQGSDLIHLALGGVMMNCGYDPDPSGTYDLPPVAPQMWQAYQITGEMTVMAIQAALVHRQRTGEGQVIDASVHQAVSANTETDIPNWTFLRQTHHRLTSRHSLPNASAPALSMTKDGRYIMPYRTYLKSFKSNWDSDLNVLRKYGMQEDLEDEKYRDDDYRFEPLVAMHINHVTDQLVGRLTFDRDLWRDAQDEGLPWAPVRRPEENATDEHWLTRDAYFDVHHPELGETFTYVGAKWFSRSVSWRRGPRPPLLGEHGAAVATHWLSEDSGGRVTTKPRPDVAGATRSAPATSQRGTPFALAGVRVVDLSWMLASAGAGRFLAGLGAEVIKVEHSSRWDTMRFGAGMSPPGGRPQRDSATEPIPTPVPTDPNRSGNFMELNAGKLGISLNLKNPQARKVLEDLIRDADMVVEGFSPGTMDRMGFGYDRLRELNPSIIYVQQTGFGQHGTYGQARAYGPTAQAFAGTTDMSGMASPYPPAGIGYSYLDWFGAYNMANAMLAALYRRDRTGEGCYIDASQGEVGIYLTGTAVLDHSVNGRPWARHGNRSPYKPAAPHGAYRTAGEDRWIAIAAFTEQHWDAVVAELSDPAWAHDERFATRQLRTEHADDLDRLIEMSTTHRDGAELMDALQQRGVPAGVCQNAEDRIDHDPQLRHLGWTVELEQADLGRWPIREHPVHLSATPSYIGGPYDRSGPSYGQDTDYVLSNLLGLDQTQRDELRAAGAL